MKFGLFYRSYQLDTIRAERNPYKLRYFMKLFPKGKVIEYSEFVGKFPYRPLKLWDDAKLVGIGFY